MVSFSTLTSGAVLLLSSSVLSQSITSTTPSPAFPACTADDVQFIIDAMNDVAEDDFNTCIDAVGVDFNTDLVPFLVAVNSDCSNSSCAAAMAKVLEIANLVPSCSIDNPLSPGENIAVVEVVGAVAGTCAGSSGGSGSGEPLPACTGDDVQFIIDAMNDVAEDDFNTCIDAVGVDFNTDLIGFLVAVNSDCSEQSCKDAMAAVLTIANLVPSCSIDNPLNPGEDIAVVEVVGAVAGTCSGTSLPACTGDDVQFIVNAMNDVAEDDFNACIDAVGVDFNTDLIGFLVAVNSDCSEQSCADAMAAVLTIANLVPSCSIDNPLSPGEDIAVVEVVGAVAGTCAGTSTPVCTGEDVQTIVDLMNNIAEDDFNTCVNAVGVDFNTDLVGFLVSVLSDCSEPTCATAIGEVVAAADQVPTCTIDNPLSPGEDITPVEVVGAVANACASGGPDLIGTGDDAADGASDAALVSTSFSVVLVSSLLSLFLA